MTRTGCRLGVAAGLSLLTLQVRAEDSTPLRVAVNCQSENTIQVCGYVRGYLGSTEGLLYGRGLLLVKDDAPRRRTVATLYLDGQPHEQGALALDGAHVAKIFEHNDAL